MEKPNAGNMTVEQLMEALKKLNPKSEIKIVIRQYNRAQAVLVMPIQSNYTVGLGRALTHNDFPIDQSYGGAITIHLPNKAIISHLNKK